MWHTRWLRIQTTCCCQVSCLPEIASMRSVTVQSIVHCIYLSVSEHARAIRILHVVLYVLRLSSYADCVAGKVTGQPTFGLRCVEDSIITASNARAVGVAPGV